VRCDEDLALAIGADHLEKLIAFVDVDRIDPVARMFWKSDSDDFLITPCLVTNVR
jgi:hypothetical protein